MMNEYDIGHDDILAVLKPSGPTIDPVVDLMGRLVIQPEAPSPVNPYLSRKKRDPTPGTTGKGRSYLLAYPGKINGRGKRRRVY